METILHLAHTQPDGSLPKVALEVLNAAVSLAKGIPGSRLVVGIIGRDAGPAADAIAGCGAQAFHGVSGEDVAVSRYATDAAALEAIVRAAGPSLVVAAGTSRFARAMPGVAFRANGRIDTHVTGFVTDGSSVAIQRWYYRQRTVATQTRTQRPWFLLVDSGVFEPWTGQPGSAALSAVDVSLPASARRTEVVGIEAASGDAQTIRPDAELLFVAGAGWTKKQADGQSHVKEAEALILDILSNTKASLGSSKSLVDQSSEGQDVLRFVSHLNQVGQTGSTPRHPKGLATCCHGEEPHVVGWRFISERRAINLDPNCGWARGKTDVLYVADAFRLIAKVNELLKSG